MSMQHSKKLYSGSWMLISLLVLLLTGCISTAMADPNNPESNQVQEVNHYPASEESQNPLGLEVGIEPTPLPETAVYRSSSNGFVFSYPVSWNLGDIDQGVEVVKGSARLVIQAWWSDEVHPAVRWYGMPAGDLVYRDKQTFLGEVIPVSYLVYEGKTKQILYNNGKVITAGDLEILIYLESMGKDYERIDLAQGIINQAKMILESFQLTTAPDRELSAAGGLCAVDHSSPPADWVLYQHQHPAFSFYHPADLEISGRDHVLELQSRDLVLRVEYRELEEAYPLPGILPEGEVELIRFETYFGEENPNPIVVERSGGQITRVSVGNLISRDTPVQFLVSIHSASGSAIDLDQANALLKVLDYLCINL